MPAWCGSSIGQRAEVPSSQSVRYVSSAGNPCDTHRRYILDTDGLSLDIAMSEECPAKTEIADRLRATERELRYRTEQYQTLLNQAQLGVYLVDADFRLREANQSPRPYLATSPVVCSAVTSTKSFTT